MIKYRSILETFQRRLVNSIKTSEIDLHKNRKMFGITDSSTMAVLVLFILYIVVFSALSIKKYQAFNFDLDMGNMLQAFYNTLRGHFMEMSWNGTDINGCMWMGHTEVIFLILFPFFALFPSAYILLILQTIAIASGGMVVYALARHLMHNKPVALVLALCYWFFPLLAALNLTDFHSDPFIIMPHLLAWYFLRTGQKKMFWGAIVLGILVKEHAFLFNFLLGIILLKQERKPALILLFLSFAQLLIITPFLQLMMGSKHYLILLEAHAIGMSNAETKPLAVILAYGELFLKNLFSRLPFVLLIIAILNYTLVKFSRGIILVFPLCMLFIAAFGSVHTHRHAILIAPIFITLVEGVARDKEEKAILLCGIRSSCSDTGSVSLIQTVAYRHKYTGSSK